MKILRGIGKSFGVFIFSFALVFAIMMLSLAKFTDHDNLSSFIPEVIATQFNITDEDELNQIHTMFLTECEGNESIKLSEIIMENVTLNCKDVEASTPQDLPSLIGTAVFDSIYYRRYDCGFIECLKRPGLDSLSVLISYKANQFFKSIQIFSWIGVGLGAILILVSVEKWDNRLKTLGIALLVIGIPMIIFGYLKDYFLPPIPEIASSIKPMIDHLFGSLNTIFLIITITGAILTAVGYSLKFFHKDNVKKNYPM